MLEGIVQPGHLHELYRTIEVARQPELLEMGDVPQIPQNGAHESIVLTPEIFVGQRSQEQEGTLPRLVELRRKDLVVAGRTRNSSGGHRFSRRIRMTVTGGIRYDTVEMAAPRDRRLTLGQHCNAVSGKEVPLLNSSARTG
jgi:hypothetical protein